jgi:urea transport system substrate-binding protein
MLVGDSIVAFFKELVGANITPRTLPVLSFTLGENELAQLGPVSLAGHYLARTRFPESPSTKDESFARRFRKKYGEHRQTSEIMESVYYGVLLWAAAVEKAGSEDVSRVRIALKDKEYALGGARVRVDPSNQHTWKIFEICRIISDNRLEVIKSSEAPIPPIPFPGPRTRAEWEAFSQQLYTSWGDNWANPLKPHTKKSK